MLAQDLRSAFARLCADDPAGQAGGITYEETLGLAVQRLVHRTLEARAGSPPSPMRAVGPPALDCPFMVSVMALPAEILAHGPL